MILVKMRPIFVLLFVVFSGSVSAKETRMSKIDRSLRSRRNVDVSNKYTQLTINTLRVHLNNEDLYFCNSDPYSGVQCPEEMVCVDWHQICDGEQTCGIQYKSQCIDRTIASYGKVDKRMCDGDENERWCVWKKMAPKRCGQDYFISGDKKAKRRRIRSMNFPDNYYNDRFCFWRIRVPEGDRISVFFRQFNTELNYDYVSVGNGEKYDNDAETIVYKHSGENLPKPKSFTSTGNVMWLTFKSDDWDSRKGFVIDFFNTRVKEAKVVGENAFKNTERISCGNTEVVEIGFRETVIVESPNFPKFYSSNMDCIWKYRVGNGRHISINFIEFSTEDNHDDINIGDGIDPRRTANLLKSFSGGKAPTNIVSKSNQVWIKFETNAAINRKGFQIQVKEKYYSECGGQLTVPDGKSIVVTSQNFPENYEPSSECLWQFVHSQERQITFKILDFETEENYDQFTLGDGFEPDENMTNTFIETHSGELPTPNVYTTSGSEGWMLFTSDDVKQMAGFIIEVYDKKHYDELFPSEDGNSEASISFVSSSVDEDLAG
ncbi:tolloid-like protein 2 [Antedon mediterranea]|uniref:tolloid-like protein 2 n=1 Tax=Antedon mediterranea TaxID=105859 RepID=UPI003AF46963